MVCLCRRHQEDRLEGNWSCSRAPGGGRLPGHCPLLELMSKFLWNVRQVSQQDYGIVIYGWIALLQLFEPGRDLISFYCGLVNFRVIECSSDGFLIEYYLSPIIGVYFYSCAVILCSCSSAATCMISKCFSGFQQQLYK